MESNQFGIFATPTSQIQDAPAVDGAIQGIPSIEEITFHLLRLEDGVILDEKVFHNDCVNLAHNMGVFLYDDLLAVLSLRYQMIHFLQIRDSGNLDVRAIGAYCREDDELFINSSYQAIVETLLIMVYIMNSLIQTILFLLVSNNAYFHSYSKKYGAKKQIKPRVQCLKKKFFFRFQDYVDLMIWKVQFLDRHHLLFKFGSVDEGMRHHETLTNILHSLLYIIWRQLKLLHSIRMQQMSFPFSLSNSMTISMQHR